MSKYRRVAEMNKIVRLEWILNELFNSSLVVLAGCGWIIIHPYLLLKYRMMAKMMYIEYLGWILNVFFKSTLNVEYNRPFFV